MKLMFNIIILFLSIIAHGQDSLLIRLPAKYSKNYALISIIDLRIAVGLTDIDLTKVPDNLFALIPLQFVYKSENSELEKTIKENTPTNDVDWKKNQKIFLDTLKCILNKEKTIYLKCYNYNEVNKLLSWYSINDFLNKKRLILLSLDKDGSFEKLKYKDRRIGAWRYFKFKGMKDEFYLYYAARGTGSIYQGCYDGRSTRLGRIIMFFQRIGW